MGPDDVAAVARMEADAFTSPWAEDTFRGLMGREGCEIWVADDGGVVVAYAVLWCVADQAELANIAVAPGHRRRGLASRLLAHLLEVAHRRHIETVFLEVRVSNEAGAALYDRFGFHEVGRRREYYDHPREDARVLMLHVRDALLPGP